MIIDFSINIKTYEEKILNNYDFFYYECPKCGSKHSLIRHGVYERNISFLKENNIHNKRIKILRLKCNSCSSTHAILPNDIVPYCIYSYSFMMGIILNVFINEESVLTLSKIYNISFQLIYSFLSRLNIFLKDCIYVLRVLSLLKDKFNPTTIEILTLIKGYSFNDSFQKIFFNKTKWVFLMNKFLNIRSKPIYIGSNGL